MEIYRRVLSADGTIRLKTDSAFSLCLYLEMIRHNNLPLLRRPMICITSPLAAEVPPITTFYESQWLSRYAAYRASISPGNCLRMLC